jgi:hypothetical protein
MDLKLLYSLHELKVEDSYTGYNLKYVPLHSWI